MINISFQVSLATSSSASLILHHSPRITTQDLSIALLASVLALMGSTETPHQHTVMGIMKAIL